MISGIDEEKRTFIPDSLFYSKLSAAHNTPHPSLGSG